MWWWNSWTSGEKIWFVSLAATGLLLLTIAWIMARDPGKVSRWRIARWLRKPVQGDGNLNVGRTGLLAGLGAGILTSLAVTFTLFAVQYSLQQSQDESTWKSSVATAADLPGFEPGHHKLNGMNFSGKQMRDADFRNTHLSGIGVKFEDSILENSHFEGADARGVDFLGAHFSGSEFANTNLSGADLRSADLSHTSISGAKSLDGALVNQQTCWPHGFTKSIKFREACLRKWEWHDPNNNKVHISYGQEWPACGKKGS
ncbi:pentapeptide repeat-containing protein [Streptomyces sp. BK340]|uniref:pentapeptide repeat-containing protein n=1 Tax=Streptomyces sp. BK340 TaxID=2572903 RepID=UPI00119F86FC|nr:pentapeptide repeat protein [Streptomyces sp. BK340]